MAIQFASDDQLLVDDLSEQDLLRRQLSKLQRTPEQTTLGLYPGEVGRAGSRFVQGMSQIPVGTLKFAGEIADTIRRHVPEGPRLDTGGQQSALKTWGQWLERQVGKLPGTEEQDFWSNVQRGYGQLGATVFGGLVARALGATIPQAAAISTVGMTGAEFDDAFQRAVERGDDRDTAFAKALGYAGVATAIENIAGAGRVFRKLFPTKEAAKQALNAYGVSKEVAKNFLAGFGEEASQRLAQDIIVEGKTDWKGPFQEGLVGAVVQGPVSTIGTAAEQVALQQKPPFVPPQKDLTKFGEAAVSGHQLGFSPTANKFYPEGALREPLLTSPDWPVSTAAAPGPLASFAAPQALPTTAETLPIQQPEKTVSDVISKRGQQARLQRAGMAMLRRQGMSETDAKRAVEWHLNNQPETVGLDEFVGGLLPALREKGIMFPGEEPLPFRWAESPERIQREGVNLMRQEDPTIPDAMIQARIEEAKRQNQQIKDRVEKDNSRILKSLRPTQKKGGDIRAQEVQEEGQVVPPAAAPAAAPAVPPTPDDYNKLRVTVQHPEKLPTGELVGRTYVQLDIVEGGENIPTNLQQLQDRGFQIPDFSALPQGQYTFAQATQKLEEQNARAIRADKRQLRQKRVSLEKGQRVSRPDVQQAPPVTAQPVEARKEAQAPAQPQAPQVTQIKSTAALRKMAAQLRSKKTQGPRLYSVPQGIPQLVWDGALEATALALETSANIADAITAGINWLRQQGINFNETKIREKLRDDIGIQSLDDIILQRDNFNDDPTSFMAAIYRYFYSRGPKTPLRYSADKRYKPEWLKIEADAEIDTSPQSRVNPKWTFDSYRNAEKHINNLLRFDPAIAFADINTDFDAIKRSVQQFANKLYEDLDAKNLKSESVRSALIAVKNFFKESDDFRSRAIAEILNIKTPAQSAGRNYMPLAPEQYSRLFYELENMDLQEGAFDKPGAKKEGEIDNPQEVADAARLMLYTGQRISTLLSLEWRDIDLERGIAKIRYRKGKRKENDAEVFWLTPQAVSVLRKIAARRNPQPTDYVLRNMGATLHVDEDTGRRNYYGQEAKHSSTFNSYLKRAANAAGIPLFDELGESIQMSAHAFRSWFGMFVDYSLAKRFPNLSSKMQIDLKNTLIGHSIRRAAASRGEMANYLNKLKTEAGRVARAITFNEDIRPDLSLPPELIGKPVPEYVPEGQRQAQPAAAPAPAKPAVTPQQLQEAAERVTEVLQVLPTDKFPKYAVDSSAIAVRPTLMQFRKVDNPETGETEQDRIEDPKWNELVGGDLLLWEPRAENRSLYDLGPNERYIVANGHHRLAFGRRVGRDRFSVQIMRESDGYDVKEARALAALQNIKEGKGTIYDAVKFLRDSFATPSEDAAVAARKFIGKMGRQAGFIAFDATGEPDGLFNQFINEQITPEQAAAIAEAAPKNSAVQQAALRQIAARKVSTPVQIVSYIQAALLAQKEQQPGIKATQSDFFKDTSFDEMLTRQAEAAASIQNELIQRMAGLNKIISLPKVSESLRKEHKQQLGDIERAKKGIEEIKRELQRWKSWGLTGNEDLQKRVRDRMQGGGASLMPDWEQIARRGHRGELTPEDRAALEVREQAAERKREQGGFGFLGEAQAESRDALAAEAERLDEVARNLEDMVMTEKATGFRSGIGVTEKQWWSGIVSEQRRARDLRAQAKAIRQRLGVAEKAAEAQKPKPGQQSLFKLIEGMDWVTEYGLAKEKWDALPKDVQNAFLGTVGQNSVRTSEELLRLINSPLADHLNPITRDTIRALLSSKMAAALPDLLWQITTEIQGGIGVGEYQNDFIRFLAWTDSNTPVHEFLHHVFRYLKAQDKQLFAEDRRNEIVRRINAEKDRNVRRALGRLLHGELRSEELKRMPAETSKSIYHLFNTTEFFVYALQDKAATELRATRETRSVLQTIRDMLRQLYLSVLDYIGLSPREDALWRSVWSGKYEYDLQQAQQYHDANPSLRPAPVDELKRRVQGRMQYAIAEIPRIVKTKIEEYINAGQQLDTVAYESKQFRTAMAELKKWNQLARNAWANAGLPMESFPEMYDDPQFAELFDRTTWNTERMQEFGRQLTIAIGVESQRRVDRLSPDYPAWYSEDKTQQRPAKKRYKMTVEGWPGEAGLVPPSPRTVQQWLESTALERRAINHANNITKLELYQKYVEQWQALDIERFMRQEGVGTEYTEYWKQEINKLRRKIADIEEDRMDIANRANEILNAQRENPILRAKRDALQLPDIKDVFTDPYYESVYQDPERAPASLADALGEDAKTLLEAIRVGSDLSAAEIGAIANEFLRKYEDMTFRGRNFRKVQLMRQAQIAKRIKKLAKDLAEAKMEAGKAQVLLEDAIRVMEGKADGAATGTVEGSEITEQARAYLEAIKVFATWLGRRYPLGTAVGILEGIRDGSVTRDNIFGATRSEVSPTGDVAPDLRGVPKPEAQDQIVPITQEVWETMAKVLRGSEDVFDGIQTLVEWAKMKESALPSVQIENLQQLKNVATPEGEQQARAFYESLVRRQNNRMNFNDAVSKRIAREIQNLQIESDTYTRGWDLFEKALEDPAMKEAWDAAAARLNIRQRMILANRWGTGVNSATTTFKGFGEKGKQIKVGEAQQEIPFVEGDVLIAAGDEVLSNVEQQKQILKWFEQAERYIVMYETIEDASMAGTGPTPVQLGLRPEVYRGLLDALPQKHNYLDPTAGSLMEEGVYNNAVEQTMKGWMFFRQFLAGTEDVLGLAGRDLRSKVVQFGNGVATARSIFHRDLQKLISARTEALKSHPDLLSDVELYREKVWNEMLSEGRQFGSRMRPGMLLPVSGERVTNEDFELYRIVDRIYTNLRQDLSQKYGKGVVFKDEQGRVLVREAAGVGTFGMPMRISNSGRIFLNDIQNAYAKATQPIQVTAKRIAGVTSAEGIVSGSETTVAPTDFSKTSTHPIVRFWNSHLDLVIRHILDAGRQFRIMHQKDYMVEAEQRLAKRLYEGEKTLADFGSLADVIAELANGDNFPANTGMAKLEFVTDQLMYELGQYNEHAKMIQAEQEEMARSSGAAGLRLSMESEFTNPAQKFMLPSNLYDYGFVSNSQIRSAEHRVVSEQTLELDTAIERAITHLARETSKLKEDDKSVYPGKWKEVDRIRKLLENLLTDLRNIANPDDPNLRRGDADLPGDLLKSSLLAPPTVGIRNTVLGMTEAYMRMAALHRAGNRFAILWGLRNVASMARNMITHLILNPNWKLTNKMREFLMDNRDFMGSGVEWFLDKIVGGYFDNLNRVQELGFSLRDPLAQTIYNNFRSAAEFQSTEERKRFGTSSFKKAVRYALAAKHSATDVYRAIGNSFFDMLINSQSLVFVEHIQETLKEAAMKYGAEHEGLGKFDPTDPRWAINTEKGSFSNRMTLAGRKKNIAEWQKFLQRADISLHQAMWDFYQRNKDNPDWKKAVLFKGRQVDALTTAFLRETNAGDVLNRPTAQSTNRLFRMLTTFMGYSSDFLVKLVGVPNKARSETRGEYWISAMPAMTGLMVAGAIFGLIAAAGVDWYKEYFQKQVSRNVSILDKEFWTNWGNARGSILAAMVSSFPLVGDMALFTVGRVINNRGYEPTGRILLFGVADQLFNTIRGLWNLKHDPTNLTIPLRDFALQYMGYAKEASVGAFPHMRQKRAYSSATGVLSKQYETLGLLGERSAKVKAGINYTPSYGIKEDMVTAMMARDSQGFMEQYRKLLDYYREKGTANPQASALRDFNALHPVTRSMGGKKPTPEEWTKVVAGLTATQKEAVNNAVKAWDRMSLLLGSNYVPFSSRNIAAASMPRRLSLLGSAASPGRLGIPRLRLGTPSRFTPSLYGYPSRSEGRRVSLGTLRG